MKQEEEGCKLACDLMSLVVTPLVEADYYIERVSVHWVPLT